MIQLAPPQVEAAPQLPAQGRQVIRDTFRSLHRVSVTHFPKFMTRLSSTYYVKQQAEPVKGESNKEKVRNQMKHNSMPNKRTLQEEDEATKKFDLLMSSPRYNVDGNESNNHSSMAPDSALRAIKQKQCCLVCYEKESNMINQPCGHGGFCEDCSKALLRKSDLCMLCRKPVTHTLVVQSVENRESLVEVVGVLKN